MIKKIDTKDLPLAINGMRKIRASDEAVDLGEYIATHKVPQAVPKQVGFSKEICGTIYDVTANFDVNGKDSVLGQFKKLLLSQD